MSHKCRVTRAMSHDHHVAVRRENLDLCAFSHRFHHAHGWFLYACFFFLLRNFHPETPGLRHCGTTGWFRDQTFDLLLTGCANLWSTHTHTHTVILWEQQQKGIMGADGGWTAGWYEVKIGHHLNAVLNPRQHIYSTWMSDCGRRR